ncbi:ribonuclease HII [Variovorax sp. RHLX14]|uniref:ribonuclease HII n=1 Tax=Variovorax sp. RHLX14 TaxID=1259731 RepID=UPI003F484681
MRSRTFLKAEQAALLWDAPGLLAGVDEAGRGPLAGPVVAAAVILDDRRPIRGLADSKTLTALQRDRLNERILERALCCSIAQATVEEIDTHNILQATMIAMRRAVEGLRLKPAKVLVDGNRLPKLDVLAEAIVRGDSRVKAISAASIIAKVHRDKLCQALHDEFPQYGFAGHKGYGTREHLEALVLHGACYHHRRSFSPVAAAFARMAAQAVSVNMPQPIGVTLTGSDGVQCQVWVQQ